MNSSSSQQLSQTVCLSSYLSVGLIRGQIWFFCGAELRSVAALSQQLRCDETSNICPSSSSFARLKADDEFVDKLLHVAVLQVTSDLRWGSIISIAEVGIGVLAADSLADRTAVGVVGLSFRGLRGPQGAS